MNRRPIGGGKMVIAHAFAEELDLYRAVLHLQAGPHLDPCGRNTQRKLEDPVRHSPLLLLRQTLRRASSSRSRGAPLPNDRSNLFPPIATCSSSSTSVTAISSGPKSSSGSCSRCRRPVPKRRKNVKSPAPSEKAISMRCASLPPAPLSARISTTSCIATPSRRNRSPPRKP